MPDPMPVLPDISDAMKVPFRLGSPTVFDGDDYSPVNASFDIEGAAARALAAYDRNNDGAIDIGGSRGGRFNLGEETRFTGSGTASIEQLAKFADENGNGDGSATVEEIADVIRMFDQDTRGDGRLSAAERRTFLEVFGEETRPFRKPIDKPMPPMIPFHPRHLDGIFGDLSKFRGA